MTTISAQAAAGSRGRRARAAEGVRPSRRAVACAAAYRRGGGGGDPTLYELLGLEPGCEEEDIKAAFRRRAKEVHPDINKEDGAEAAFVQLSRAYEVLSDPDSRRQYDITIRTRRINFFTDIVEDEDGDSARSPFRWSRVGRRGGRGGGLRPDDDDDEEEEADGEEGGRVGDEEEGEGEQGPGRQRFQSREDFLEELAKFMSNPGSLRAFQSGRQDPWGTSTSDTWFRQVERQTRDPYGPARPGYGSTDDDDPAGGAGRDSEWNHPRRQWDEENRRGGGPGRQGGGGGGGGDFRRPFKI
ncbi:Chaperone protein DnaJ [Tetrabaena socialis]|uniref:Chaperone protein DnaJ n=1 Tax=Tetrabaena socialis TaxID=47790 RepID=A0A2J7ZP24_9CHLO|nr:Chaperone protein DnaJ [Tetrabaena socialis]|eukprot:PNH02024.1 Chaperone protein DnaJ [Tetrabaena socialis]